MAVMIRNPVARAATRVILAVQMAALPADPAVLALEQPSAERSFDWNAQVVTSDFRNDVYELSGNVRVSQGTMSIEAGKATARGLQSDHSRWSFQDSVHIRTAEADLKSDAGDANFIQGRIADARVHGTPAQFAQLGGRPDRQVRGEAGVIEYDFGAGIVKLSQDVWFSNGKDEFRGDVVIYDIRDERVQINPGGQSTGRVRGIIRQRERKPPAGNAPIPEPRATAPGVREPGANGSGA